MFLDSTKFTIWNKSLVEFYLLVRKAEETCYPVAIALGLALKLLKSNSWG